MKYEGFQWKCKICSDGRLYDGAWIHKSIIPNPLPYNEVLFDEFPENTNCGADYLWDGETLTYSPAEQPAPQSEEEEVTYTA